MTARGEDNMKETRDGEDGRRRRPLKVALRCREDGPGKPRREAAGPWRMALWDGQMRWVRPVHPWHLSRYWFAFDASKYGVRPIEWDIGPVTWHASQFGSSIASKEEA